MTSEARRPALPSDGAWVLVETADTPAREHEVESLCTVANGFVGTRGGLAEGSAWSAPATFLAGVFEGGGVAGPRLAVLPDWCRLAVSVNGSPLHVVGVGVDDAAANAVDFENRRVLDFLHASLLRTWRHRDESGRVTLIELARWASLADRHVLAQSLRVTAENYGGVIAIDARLEGVEALKIANEECVAMAFGARTPRERVREKHASRLVIDARVGEAICVDRLVAVAVDVDEARAASAASTKLAEVMALGIEAAAAEHRAAWRSRWERSDVHIDGDEEAQRAARLAVYHLVSAANPDDERVSIGARALTGRGYRGHVFWDTDIYMLPFFTLTYPEAARALLLYRYHSLPAARAHALATGFRGARFAWESAATGEEVSPRAVLTPRGEVLPIHVAEQEQHITACVAFAAVEYWRCSADDDFMVRAGAELVVEAARFWASRVQREDDGMFHVRGVIGPDEYHEAVDDNAFTNGMAQWNLETAASIVALLGERWPARLQELGARIALDTREPDRWREIAARMTLRLDERGVIEQFDGYFGLDDVELPPFAQRTAPMDVLLGHERIRRTKVVKQPDVLMLLFLLWERFPAHVREACFRYYEPRTDHGSSLSPAIHALFAAKLGDVDAALAYFRQAAEIDLADNMGNAALGVHVGALGGLWQALVFGFAGLHFDADGPRLRPCLPERWTRLAFHVQWHGRSFAVDLPRSRAASPLEVTP